MDPETLEPLPVERLLHGLSAQLIGDLTSAAEQDQSLKQPFLEQLVPALSVGDFPEKELLTSSSWRMSDLSVCWIRPSDSRDSAARLDRGWRKWRSWWRHHQRRQAASKAN